MILLDQIKTILNRITWDTQLESLPWWKALPIRGLRVAHVVIRDFTDGQLTLQAMSLVYTTLLSIVPLLAVSFSVLKGFEVHNQIEPILLNFLKPLGASGVEISSNIIGLVDRVKAGVLGSVGLALLIYTVISLIQKIERAFNYTWNVTHTRPIAQRFSDYLSVIIIGPILIFTAMGITASLKAMTLVQKLLAIKAFGSLFSLGTQLLPYFLVILAFTFIYIFVPNTKVHLRSALTGAVVAGILWQATGWGFASFIAISTKYTAIYAGLAILIFFMIWLYLSWLILLVGASVAFFHQRPEALQAHRRELQLSNRFKEKLALLVLSLVGHNFYNNRPAWTIEGLAHRLHLPTEALEPIVEALERDGLLSHTGDDPPAYLPARPLETTELKDVLDVIRQTPKETHLALQSLAPELAIEKLVGHLDQAISEAFQGRTLKDLALLEPAPVSSDSEAPEKQVSLSGRSRDS
jgi:membrane protein